MKRAGSLCVDCPAKRQRAQLPAAQLDDDDCDGCSSASPCPPVALHPLLRQQMVAQPGLLLPQRQQQLTPQAKLQPVFGGLVEHVLERTLCDADSALNLTLHAMHLATQIYECGAPDAADRALNIAEQALAATMQQLARAQALVVHKAGQQHVGLHAAAAGAEEEDSDLQDTCSSSFSGCTSACLTF